MLIFKKRMGTHNIFITFIFSLLISLNLTVPIDAVETVESIKASYQHFLSKIDRKYFDEKIPFLLTTEWDQSGKYAAYTPTKVRVGCWSTAIAQILFYHKLLPKGKVRYHCSQGYQISEDLESYKFNWDLFVNKIDDNSPKTSVEQVAIYSYVTAVAIEKDFGTGLYTAIKTGWTGADFIKFIV